MTIAMFGAGRVEKMDKFISSKKFMPYGMPLMIESVIVATKLIGAIIVAIPVILLAVVYFL